jgi:hypothetical protein
LAPSSPWEEKRRKGAERKRRRREAERMRLIVHRAQTDKRQQREKQTDLFR